MGEQNNKIKALMPPALLPEFDRVWDTYGDTLQKISDLYVSLAQHHDIEAWKIVNALISMSSQMCVHMMNAAEKTHKC